MTRATPPRLSLADLVDELDGLSTDELHALAKAIAREIETREKPRRML